MTSRGRVEMKAARAARGHARGPRQRSDLRIRSPLIDRHLFVAHLVGLFGNKVISKDGLRLCGAALIYLSRFLHTHDIFPFVPLLNRVSASLAARTGAFFHILHHAAHSQPRVAFLSFTCVPMCTYADNSSNAH